MPQTEYYTRQAKGFWTSNTTAGGESVVVTEKVSVVLCTKQLLFFSFVPFTITVSKLHFVQLNCIFAFHCY